MNSLQKLNWMWNMAQLNLLLLLKLRCLRVQLLTNILEEMVALKKKHLVLKKC